MLRVCLICALHCTSAMLPCSSSTAAAVMLYADTLCLVLTYTYVADAIWYISALVLTLCANVPMWISGQLPIKSHKNLCTSAFRLAACIALSYMVSPGVHRSTARLYIWTIRTDWTPNQSSRPLTAISQLVGPMATMVD